MAFTTTKIEQAEQGMASAVRRRQSQKQCISSIFSVNLNKFDTSAAMDVNCMRYNTRGVAKWQRQLTLAVLKPNVEMEVASALRRWQWHSTRCMCHVPCSSAPVFYLSFFFPRIFQTASLGDTNAVAAGGLWIIEQHIVLSSRSSNEIWWHFSP